MKVESYIFATNFMPNETTTETAQNNTAVITADVIDKISVIESVLAKLTPAFATVVDSFKQQIVDTHDMIAKLECANRQIDEKIGEIGHVHTRMQILENNFKKFDGNFAMIDYLHEHLPKTASEFGEEGP